MEQLSYIDKCWVIFLILISVMGMLSTSVRNKKINSQDSFLQWAHLPLLALSKVLIVGLFPYLNYRFVSSSSVLKDIGVWLIVISILFSVVSAIIFLLNTFQRSSSFEQQLIIKGPYKYFRNPVYSGILGSFLGQLFIHASISALVGTLLAIAIYIKKIKVEEKYMLQQFGARYLKYMTSSWSLFPFIY